MTPSVEPVLAAVALTVPFALWFALRPLPRRLALAEVRGRRGRAALVVAAALLATAVVTCALVVGDSLRASIRQSAADQLGPVDEVVVIPGVAGAVEGQAGAVENQAGAVEGQAGAVEDQARADTEGVRDTLSLLRMPVTVLTTGFVPLAEPGAHLLEVDFDRAARFGGDPAATGITGPTPTGTEAVVSSDLADRIQLQPGSRIRVYAYGATHQFTVARVLPRTGIAGLGGLPGDQNPESANVFVAPGTIAALAAQAGSAAVAQPPTTVVTVANRDGVAGTGAVVTSLGETLADRSVDVQPVKQRVLDRARSQTADLRRAFALLGIFTVIAAMLVMTAALGLLVLERRPTLGVLRSLGIRRSVVVAAFALEGWLYALVAAVLGVIVGTALARVVLLVAGDAFGSVGAAAIADPVFAPQPASLVSGFAIGLAASLIAVALAVVEVRRRSPVRLSRATSAPTGVTAGPRRLLLVGGIGAGVAVIAAVVTLGSAGSGTGLGPVVALVIGLALVAVAVAVALTVLAALGSLGRRSRRLTVRLALGSVAGRGSRVALAVTAEALVVFTLALLIGLSGLAGARTAVVAARLGGNATVLVRSNPTNPLPIEAVEQTEGVAGVVATDAATATVSRSGGADQPAEVVGFDGDFPGHGSPPLLSRADRFPSDAAVFEAVADDPTMAVVGADLGRTLAGGVGQPAPKVGETLTLRDPVTGSTRDVVVAGIAARARFGGADHVFVSRSQTDSLFGAGRVAGLLYVSTSAGANRDLTAAVINGSHLANGTNAQSFHQLAVDEVGTTQRLLTLLTAFAAIGSLAAIGALAVTMTQSVSERRHDIGIVRAIGMRARAVRRAVRLEAVAIAGGGVVAGLAASLIAIRILTAGRALGDPLPFEVPVAALAALVVVTMVAAVVAAAVPARRAARLRPADSRRAAGAP